MTTINQALGKLTRNDLERIYISHTQKQKTLKKYHSSEKGKLAMRKASKRFRDKKKRQKEACLKIQSWLRSKL